ncbi:phosphoglucosamine mutase [Smithella sp. F21]|jgi:phosphoglucosamine mutase|nr:phosphoglucosamine mutase [Smithella sp. F21]MDD4861362.1 phosphoglucosamine mutase [Smithellaceae bacterium]HBJ75813.1 phosphoglucosamine mutase [Syntrophaceae bacterium]HCS76746.1 phosphoglucosamine mutase [Syntrophaceae bacterium]HCX01008.1 phosphoglucosamine mutase [Syntrophaceae bacterium]
MGKLFGTDGIRGEANQYPMTPEIAFGVGRAIAHLFKKDGHRAVIIIGKDTRLSGYMLESSLEAGITSMGGYSYLVGVMPTPAIAFVTQSMRADAGVVISASHNPFQDNGLKIFGGDGYKLSDDQEDVIEDLILNNKLSELLPTGQDIGKAFRLEGVNGRYIVFAKNTFPRHLSMEGMKIVLDTANGATYRVAPDTFTELGASVEVIHKTPNGVNINDKCGSQHTEVLREKVVESGAAIGLAFDGDGDRLIAIDEKGREITGDQIMVICANILKREGKLKNDLLVTTVMSNLGLTVACKKYGFRHHASKVGDRYVLEDMKKLDGIIGGEEAGHMIFLDHHTTGDGIIAALQLVAAMVKEGKPLSELARMMDIFPQKLINIDVKSKPDIDKVPKLADAIQQVEKELGDEGRVLVRYSGTQNMCRVMVEGPSDSVTEKYCRQLAEVVKSEIG